MTVNLSKLELSVQTDEVLGQMRSLLEKAKAKHPEVFVSLRIERLSVERGMLVIVGDVKKVFWYQFVARVSIGRNGDGEEVAFTLSSIKLNSILLSVLKFAFDHVSSATVEEKVMRVVSKKISTIEHCSVVGSSLLVDVGALVARFGIAVVSKIDRIDIGAQSIVFSIA